MGKFTYENQGTNTFLVYQIGENDAVDTMSLGMLTNNKISGLAQTFFMQADVTKYIKYNVSSKVSVKQFFSGPVNKARLIGVFSGIVDAMLSAEEYMINPNSILLDLDYIFADVTTCATVLVCLPLINSNNTYNELGSFFKTIMFSTQFDQTENCDHIAKIINYLNSTAVFSLVEFKNLLDEIKGTESSAIQQAQHIAKQPTVPAQQPIIRQPVQNPLPPQRTRSVAQQGAVSNMPNRTIPQPSMTTQQGNNGAPMQRPLVQRPMNQPPVTPSQPSEPEKKMSMFYLLQHYNKENAELYKNQKNAKKNQELVQTPANRTAAHQPNMMGRPAVRQPNQINRPVRANVPFAIPGQPAPAVQQRTQTQSRPQPQRGAMQPQRPAQPQFARQPMPMQHPASERQTPLMYTPQPAVPVGKPMNFGETTVLGGGNIGETTVLDAAPSAVQIQPQLIRMKNNERVFINKPVFRIGKEKSYVDYFISDNTAISRSHANIIVRGKEYFVVDTNSTNHTYVNGKIIQSNIETPIVHGSKIKFANENFEFKLY